MELIWLFLKIVIFLPGVLGLIYISLKFGGIRLQELQNGRFIKILDRVLISKENSLLVIKIGDKAYVMSSANGKVEILQELSEEDLTKVEASKVIHQYGGLKELYENLKRRKINREKEYIK